MKFSLILCTVNRTKEVQCFFSSLTTQIYKNFEVIVVDQNKDNRVKKIINEFQFLNIKYITSKLGLSHARNIGLQYAIGDIVCFPDDDCTYPNLLLSNVKDFFENSDYDILMGKAIDQITKKIVAGKLEYIDKELKPSNILGSSTTLFLKMNKFKIKFDERFGLGAIFNSEEENDLLFRLLSDNIKGYYNPIINYVYHPASDLDYRNFIRAKDRSIGLGAFIAKHLFSFDGMVYFIKYNLIRPLFGAILFLCKFDIVKSRFYLNKFIGIWIGFFKYFKVQYEINF